MIERQLVSQKKKEFMIQEFISKFLPKQAYSRIELKRTPLGEKIIVYTTRPGMVVGRRGENIVNLTNELKKKFNLENPQIEVGEVENPNIDPKTIADRIVSSFERFGPKRFKSIGYRALQNVMDAGAKGSEIVIAGRGVPSQRSKTWRFSAGHMKKSGDVSENFIKREYATAALKSGTIGIKVSILTPDIILPDDIKIRGKQEIKVIPVEEAKKPKSRKKPAKKQAKEKTVKENGNNEEERNKTNE